MNTDQSNFFDSVCKQARRAALLQSAAETLEWDERTGMPPKASEYRAQQISTLNAMVHELRTDETYGENLESLSQQIDTSQPNDIAATVRGLTRDWRRNRKLPTDLVKRISTARVRGQQVWDESRRADDFAIFAPVLKEMVSLQRESGDRMAEGTDRDAYGALLDTYEPDAKTAELQQVFDELRTPLVQLIAEIRDAPRQPKIEILERDFPVDAQKRFSRWVAEQIGFDFQRGRLDETSHPFCTTLGPHDCRILSRYESNWLPGGLFGTMHEAGHGMYEQGLRTDDWFGLPPGSYGSLGIHESQSRLWENQIGRSRSFWRWLYPHAQNYFSSSLSGVDPEDFFFAINTIRPSLIRVEADEATYNLHILIRFDLEQALINGTLSVADLPEAWNERYRSDLGITPPSDADGVLQDVHWSAGLFGYFPTYTLGNVISAQLHDAAAEQLGDLDAMFAQGNFQPLLQWLRENVHTHGQCLSQTDLVKQTTGASLSATSLIEYLRSKLRPLYGLTG
ncbi:carboxypeptidase M32 [Planctomycetes bacterium K23_9]|uniref:Metal-dependent carboxypeptidase n=1 Tax=Stieleria marina TaxID=1930275 RepID=A0A517NTN4_9BACT|nr:Thermostable carboxypeptidase 1 [Planctomycetes bacterium K23_9]